MQQQFKTFYLFTNVLRQQKHNFLLKTNFCPLPRLDIDQIAPILDIINM